MGAVYRAFDEIIGESVALKVLHDDDPQIFTRFKQEVVLARKVTHRNIARTFDIGLDAGRPFLTMELVEGESLRQRSKRIEASVADIATIISQVAAGLGAAHAASVIHQDLKPGNVLVANNGRVVVIDFGVAAVFDPAAITTNELVGTFDYMAPEQVEGGAPRPASDIYALGLITYELFTRRRAFEGETPHARALSRLDRPAPSLSSLPKVPRELVAVVASCLALAPEQRPTAEEVVQVLAYFAKPTIQTSPSRESERPGDATIVSSVSHQKSIRVFSFTSDSPSLRAWDVGATIAEELSDLLSRTKGIQVLASEEEGSKKLGAGEGAAPDLVVLGSVRETDGVVSMTARLVEDKSGDQIWSGRFEGSVGELLEMGGQLAAQVTEALRLELEALPYQSNVPPEAIELYLRARQISRSAVALPSAALLLLDRCLAIAPSFSVAVAARAFAVARTYSFADFAAGDVTEEAPRAIARALQEAPHLPDTQLAIGLVALQQGNYSIAIQALEKAVSMAPTHALALEQLGRVEIEAGRGAQGLARLKLTASLDPQRRSCLFPVARAYALRGNIDAFDRTIAQIKRNNVTGAVEELSMQGRVANWSNDPARAKKALVESDRLIDRPGKRIVVLSLEMAAGADVGIELRNTMDAFLKLPASPRLRALVNQVAAELFARRDQAIATQYLLKALAEPLVDIEWIELCPALDPLRSLPVFEAARSTVQARIRAMWTDPETKHAYPGT
jgi:TolB-like protein/tetratricopeptide (TPR) repeat protein